MLTGALLMGADESLNIFEEILGAIKDFFR